MNEGRFRVVMGGRPASRRRNLSKWECRQCEAIIGVRTRVLIKLREQAFEDAKGRITGGRDIWACATCLGRGVVTPVTA